VKNTIGDVQGFHAVGLHAGIKKADKLDFALIHSDRACTAAGVFTRNLVKAAPVLLDMQHLQTNASSIRAVVMNSGCANACTGPQGMQNAQATAAHAAAALGCAPQAVLVLSTGVIGQQLPMAAIKHGIDQSIHCEDDWQTAAEAIMTTDTRPKLASVTVETTQGNYTIAGIAKGAGMIAPNMATMLGVIVTDAALTPEQATDGLQAANKISFNRIVIDGDMSTNDTVLLLANGASSVTITEATDLMAFNLALTQVCIQLAKAIVRDGEGATKFITLAVTNAPDDEAAHKIANAVATSPLVKTAFYGRDANWGRVVAAVGYAGVPLDPDKLTISIQSGESIENGFVLFHNGTPHDDEATASQIMQADAITVTIDCAAGYGEAVVWTCDLSHEYISINGDYRS